MTFTPNELDYCSKNVSLLIRYINPTFKAGSYVPNQTFNRMNISPSTLRNVLAARNASQKTLNIIAASFSTYLEDLKDGEIQPKELLMLPENFQKLYPKSRFRTDTTHNSAYLDLYTNKLYRGYFRFPYSSSTAHVALFKLFHTGKRLSAYMVRGIYDLNHISDILNNFDDPSHLIQCIDERKKLKENDKKQGALTLYIATADENAISVSEKCIQIHFKSYDSIPCCSSMYWNIETTSKNLIGKSSYNGGTALMVDTNDGLRAKEISAFKLCFEAVTQKIGSSVVDIPPADITAPELLDELSPMSKYGVLILDRAEDSRWYRFITDNVCRDSRIQTFSLNDIQKIALDLLKLKDDYSQEILRLKSYLDGKV